MRWSQIKLTSYDFGDLQLTLNLKTARALDKNKSFSVCGHISYRRRLASVYDNIGRCPTGHRATRLQKQSKANKSTRRISTVGSSTHIIVWCPDGHRSVTGPSIFGARTFIVGCSDGHRSICWVFSKSPNGMFHTPEGWLKNTNV